MSIKEVINNLCTKIQLKAELESLFRKVQKENYNNEYTLYEISRIAGSLQLYSKRKFNS